MDRVDFWDKKILHWERDKYSSAFYFDFNASVKKRRIYAADFLKKFAVGKRVLELGCGSGTLLPLIKDFGLMSYTGVDFSSVAIKEAKSRKLGSSFKAEFLTENMDSVCADNFDIVISLGLTDWLELGELKHLAKISKGKIFLHSFSRDQATFFKKIHETYVYLMYSRKTKTYKPKYYSKDFLAEIFGADIILHGDGLVGYIQSKQWQ